MDVTYKPWGSNMRTVSKTAFPEKGTVKIIVYDQTKLKEGKSSYTIKDINLVD